MVAEWCVHNSSLWCRQLKRCFSMTKNFYVELVQTVTSQLSEEDRFSGSGIRCCFIKAECQPLFTHLNGIATAVFFFFSFFLLFFWWSTRARSTLWETLVYSIQNMLEAIFGLLFLLSDQWSPYILGLWVTTDRPCRIQNTNHFNQTKSLRHARTV